MTIFQVKYRSQFDSLYNKAVKEIKPESFIWVEPTDSLAKNLCPSIKPPFVSAIVSTSLCTISVLQYNGIIVPRGGQFVHQRFYRSCCHDGSPHANANDLLLFPTKDGRIGGISRSDSPDHYIALMNMAGIEDLIQTYHLPKEKYGHINLFTAAGATIPPIVSFQPVTVNSNGY